MPGNLENSPNTWESGEFPKFLKFLKEFEGSFFVKYKKYKCLAIWKISQISIGLRNSPNIHSFEKFQKS